MCRWIAYLSEQPIMLSDIITKPHHPLIWEVSHHFLPGVPEEQKGDWAPNGGLFPPNASLNIDGWGVGYYNKVAASYDHKKHARSKEEWYSTPPAKFEFVPVLLKSVLPAIHDVNIKEIADANESTCIFAHVRAGDNVGVNNNHPFKFGRFLFQHNGVYGPFKRIQPDLLKFLDRQCPTVRGLIQGTTDSEHIAALFFAFLSPEGDWFHQYHISELVTALLSTLSYLNRVAQYDSYPNTYASLALSITDGSQLVALCYATPDWRPAASLYYSTVVGPVLDKRYQGADELRGRHGRHVVVGSEPCTYETEDWTRMRNGECLIVGCGEAGAGERFGGEDPDALGFIDEETGRWVPKIIDVRRRLGEAKL